MSKRPAFHGVLASAALALCGCGGHKAGGDANVGIEDGGTGITGAFVPQVGGAPDGAAPIGPPDFARCMTLGQGLVSATAFSPDGTLLAVAGTQLRLLSADDWHEVRKFDDSSLEYPNWWRLAFTAGGALLVGTGYEGQVGVWRVEDGSLLHTLSFDVNPNGEPWEGVAASTTGLLALTDGASVVLWDAAERRTTHAIEPTRGRVGHIAFSDRGDLLAIDELDGRQGDGGTQFVTARISLWDAATGRSLRTIATQGAQAEGLTFSPGADVLVALMKDSACGYDGCDSYANFYRTSDATLLRRAGPFPVSPAGTLATQLVFSPRGDLVAVSIQDYYRSANDTLSIIRTSDAAVVNVLLDPWGAISFSPDGGLLLPRGTSVEIRDPMDGTIMKIIPFGPGNYASAFSPDGQFLATADANDVYLWRLADGAIVSRFPGLGVAVQSLVFSPDGQTIASGGEDAIVRMWRTTGGSAPVVLQQDQPVTAVAFSPAGTLFAAGDVGGTVYLRSAKDATVVNTLHAQDSGQVLVFSPDGKVLATGGTNPAIVLWNVETGQAIASASHGGGVVALAFSADGSLLASAASCASSVEMCYPEAGDPEIRLWQIAGSSLVIEATIATEPVVQPSPQVPVNAVWGLTFSPDGQTLLTAGPQHAWHLYRLPQGEPIGQFGPGRVFFGLTFAISPDAARIAVGAYPIEIWCGTP
jgi:WD40 repeat protein